MYIRGVYSFRPARQIFLYFITVIKSEEERYLGNSNLYFGHHLSSYSLLSTLSTGTLYVTPEKTVFQFIVFIL
jgi:hypothetical protein